MRGRLTLWHAGALSLTLLALGAVSYFLLRSRIQARVDARLGDAVEAAATLLRRERAEGENPETAAISVVQEALTVHHGVAILDRRGRVLAERSVPGVGVLPSAIAGGGAEPLALSTHMVGPGLRVRAGTRRIDDLDGGYAVVVIESLQSVDEDLASARRSAFVVLPLAALLAAGAGWIVAGRALRPVLAMSQDVRTLGAADLRHRLEVRHPEDELGHLAQTFNEMLGRLEDTFERQRRFMADASHELRTPLSIVRTAASMILHRPQRSEAEYREVLAVVLDQAERSSRLVDDLLLLARADSGEYPVRRRPMDLSEMVVDCVRLARVLGQAAAVTVRSALTSPAPETPYEGDEDLLRRMLMNLCENAIAHTPAGGVVEVGLARTPAGYEVRVTDAGGGVAPGDEERIFERFFRADGREGVSGAGLGLPIGRWIAGVHHGVLRLVPAAKGTTFVAALPWTR